jgi:hypothetical protein
MRELKPMASFLKLSMFFDKTAPVWLALKSLTADLNHEKLNYAVIGGIAVYMYGYERTTNDCDILLSKEVNTFVSINQRIYEFHYFYLGSWEVH